MSNLNAHMSNIYTLSCIQGIIGISENTLYMSACNDDWVNDLSVRVFQEHHEEDLFLYMTYSNESVYGAWAEKKFEWLEEGASDGLWACARVRDGI